MNSIELLARILNTYLCEEFLLASYSKYSDQLNELINAGLLFSCGKSNKVFCDKCDEPHYATIQKINNVLKWRCPETGFHDVDLQATDRDLYKVNLELLINKIQESLELKKTNLQRMKTDIEGLYNIENETLLYISEQHPQSNENLYNYIQNTKSRSSRGMVLCTFEDFSNRPYELPRSYKLVPFNKVVLLNKNNINVTFELVYGNFLLDAAYKQKKQVGRQGTGEEITNAIEALYDQDSEFGNYNKTQKATAIHEYLGKPKTPSNKTIYNHLTSNKKTA